MFHFSDATSIIRKPANRGSFESIQFPYPAKEIIGIVEYQGRLFIALKTGVLVSAKFPIGTWRRQSLPEGYTLNTLQVTQEKLWVSTDQGLFYWNGNNSNLIITKCVWSGI